MTLDVLKNEKECVLRNISGCDRNCANCDLVLQDKDIISAYDDAISALEKQIPKKPIKQIIVDRVEYSCPHCFNAVGEDRKIDTGSMIVVFREHHCTCGQTLDWTRRRKERENNA